MIKTFPIEFVRVAILQTLYEQHLKDSNLIGGDDQINIFSFYEQLKTQGDVDRFVENYRDLTDQQNSADLICNGIIASTENPTITNLYSATIIPMNWACFIRTKLSNRDQVIRTINNLIEELKGSKVDMAQLETTDDNGRKIYVPFKVGTVGHNEGYPRIKSGDYMGFYETSIPEIDNFPFEVACGLYSGDYVYMDDEIKLETYLVGKSNRADTYTFNSTNSIVEITQGTGTNIKIKWSSKQAYNEDMTSISSIQLKLRVNGALLTWTPTIPTTIHINNSTGCLYCNWTVDAGPGGNENIEESSFELTLTGNFSQGHYTYTKIVDDGSYPNVVFVPENTSFEKYKLSMSFEAIRCDEPRTLNGDDYCEISFGGSATLVNNKVKLGNDLIKIGVDKTKIVGDPTYDFYKTSYLSNFFQYLEPLEMPSGNNANTVISQLASNYFKLNTHTDGLAINLQYSFIIDENIEILEQWFDYARYGTYGIGQYNISPNIIYTIREIWSSWGQVRVYDVLGKIVENIDIENSESDTLTLSVNFQIQGENN